MKTKLILLSMVFAFILISESFAQRPTPRPSWKDSYRANGECFCETTFDHNIGNQRFTINGVNYRIQDICDELEKHPKYRRIRSSDPIYNDIQCGNGPANNAGDEDQDQCPGRVDLGRSGCTEKGPKWDVNWLSTRTRFGGNGDNGGNDGTSPAGYTFASDEGGTVVVSGSVDIAYGANGQYNFLTNQSSNVTCNNSTFGDPIPGISKKCFTRPSSTIPSGGLDVCAVSASSAQSPNVASNVLDGDLSTRWSANGNGQTLVLDLCDEYNLTEVKIAFYRGNVRSSSFDIQVSNNNSTWSSVLTGASSSGNSLLLEDFDIMDVTARYVRYVGLGNSDNDWNSVTAIEVHGEPATSMTDGGTVATSSGQTSVITITGDGQADVVNFTNTSSSSEDYIYLVTDASGNILTTETSSHDFEGASVGICLVYGLSYTGSLSVSGKNVSSTSLASGEFSLSSNSIEIDRQAPTAPSISIESFDDQQSPNNASNLLDGLMDDNNRWSAKFFSKSVVFDLGSSQTITGLRMWTYQNRAYQYRVQTSNSPSTGFTTVADQTTNTSSAQPLSTSFSSTARYVRLTVTGASGYGGDWVSINEVEIETSGNSARIGDASASGASIYPNPSEGDVVINLGGISEGTVVIADISGNIIYASPAIGSTHKVSAKLSPGIYFISLTGTGGEKFDGRLIVK